MRNINTLALIACVIVVGCGLLLYGGESSVASPGSDQPQVSSSVPIGEPVRIHFRRADDIRAKELPTMAKLSFFDGQVTAIGPAFVTLEMQDSGTRWIPITSIAYIRLVPETAETDNAALNE
jgi:hypothetical protein